MKKMACIFPGQGSQEVGMAGDLLDDPLSAWVFLEANDVLKFDLTKLVSEGPQETLTLTANAQPAILATSFAAWKQFIKAVGYDTIPAYVAGHSLGEFSALAASGALELQDALRLVRKRGELMQENLPPGEGSMAAFLGGNETSLKQLISEAAQGRVLEVANLNAPGQVVLSGHDDAINRAVLMAKKLGFTKAVKLQVSAPFHCSLMTPVREKFAPELKGKKFMPPICPIVHNVSAQPNNDPLRMSGLLARQVDNPVRWVETIRYMLDQNVKIFIEIGYGKVLQGLVKKIAGKDFDGIITGYSSQKDSERIIGELGNIKISEGGFDITDVRTRMQEDLMKELDSFRGNGSDANGGVDV